MSHYNDFYHSNIPRGMSPPRGDYGYGGRRPMSRPPSQQFYPQMYPAKRKNMFDADLPQFDMEKLKHQRDVVMMETLPCSEEDDVKDHPLCSLIKESFENQSNLLAAFDNLAAVMAETEDFIATVPDVQDNSRQIYNLNCDLKSRYVFMNELDNSLFQNVENFFNE